MASQTPFEAEATRIIAGFTSLQIMFKHPHARDKFVEFLRGIQSQNSGLMLAYISNLQTKFGSEKVLGTEPLIEGDEDLIYEFDKLFSLLSLENFPSALSEAILKSYSQTLKSILNPSAGEEELKKKSETSITTASSSSTLVERYNQIMLNWHAIHIFESGNFWKEVKKEIFSLFEDTPFADFKRSKQMEELHSDLIAARYPQSFESFDFLHGEMRAIRIAIKHYVDAIDKKSVVITYLKDTLKSYGVIKNFKIISSSKESLTLDALKFDLELMKDTLKEDEFPNEAKPAVEALIKAMDKALLAMAKNILELAANPNLALKPGESRNHSPFVHFSPTRKLSHTGTQVQTRPASSSFSFYTHGRSASHSPFPALSSPTRTLSPSVSSGETRTIAQSASPAAASCLSAPPKHPGPLRSPSSLADGGHHRAPASMVLPGPSALSVSLSQLDLSEEGDIRSASSPSSTSIKVKG